MDVSEPFWPQNFKNVIFISVRCLKMLQIGVWKKWRHQRLRFLGHMFPKYINLKFSMPDVRAWLYNKYSGFWKFWKYRILKKLPREKILFLFFEKLKNWVRNFFLFLGNPRWPFQRTLHFACSGASYCDCL